MNVIAQSVIQFHYTKYMYFFKVKYTKLCNVPQKNYRAQHKLLVNATPVSSMSALASMTGLTGWLELNKQGDSSGRLVTKVLFLGYCTISLFGGEPSCFDLLLTGYYIVPKTSAAILELRNTRPHVWNLVIFQLLNFIMAGLGRAFAKKKSLLCRLAGPI